MGKPVQAVVELKCFDNLEESMRKNGEHFGLIIGTFHDDSPVIVHLSPTPTDAAGELSDKERPSTSNPKSCLFADGANVALVGHVEEVSRALPSGLAVLGVYHSCDIPKSAPKGGNVDEDRKKLVGFLRSLHATRESSLWKKFTRSTEQSPRSSVALLMRCYTGCHDLESVDLDNFTVPPKLLKVIPTDTTANWGQAQGSFDVDVCVPCSSIDRSASDVTQGLAEIFQSILDSVCVSYGEIIPKGRKVDPSDVAVPVQLCVKPCPSPGTRPCPGDSFSKGQGDKAVSTHDMMRLRGSVTGLATFYKTTTHGTVQQLVKEDLIKSVCVRLHILSEDEDELDKDQPLPVGHQDLPARVTYTLPSVPRVRLSLYWFRDESCGEMAEHCSELIGQKVTEEDFVTDLETFPPVLDVSESSGESDTKHQKKGHFSAATVAAGSAAVASVCAAFAYQLWIGANEWM